MGFATRDYKRSRIEKAGRRIAKGVATDEDWAVLSNWRAVHAYVLNTFQCNIRRLFRSSKKHTFAQRMKRKPTIIDKLQSKRGADLATMQDIAGCRIICDDIAALDDAREKMRLSRSSHVRIDHDKYNYIDNPKPDGYRGVHEVFEYCITGDTAGKAYNELRVEIQYRTKVQHAWATALETSDLLDKTRLKFESGKNPDKERFFQLCSEYLARKYEWSYGPLPDVSDEYMVDELRALENSVRVIHRLRHAEQAVKVPSGKNLVLHFGGDKLRITAFHSIKRAQEYVESIEDLVGDDAVYVRADDQTAVKLAFQNYFTNSKFFLRLMREVWPETKIGASAARASK